MDSNQTFLHLLNTFPKFGPVRLAKLINHFSSPEQALRSSEQEMEKSGIEKKIASEFKNFKRGIDPEREINKLKQNKIGVITILDENYPELLKEISRPPIILYYRGEKNIKQNLNLAVVGSRKISNYGRQALEVILNPLLESNQKINIISGLALGIDTHAHQIALNKRIYTVAVLGSGLDEKSVFPYENKRLAQKIIASGGSLISEFPPGTPPLKHHFPQRNRIVAGLSKIVMVVEAEKRSGALITAHLALEENREVAAVPGSIFSPTSQGTNELIGQGAEVITDSNSLTKLAIKFDS